MLLWFMFDRLMIFSGTSKNKGQKAVEQAIALHAVWMSCKVHVAELEETLTAEWDHDEVDLADLNSQLVEA